MAFKQLAVGKEGKSGINNEDKRMKKALITGITGQEGTYFTGIYRATNRNRRKETGVN